MNVCDVCIEMMPVACKYCMYGNPCLGCKDYSETTDTCKSDGGCGRKINDEGRKNEKGSDSEGTGEGKKEKNAAKDREKAFTTITTLMKKYQNC